MPSEVMKLEPRSAAVAPSVPDMDMAALEKVLLQGDLEQLKPHERVSYYGALCRSLNLNPLTKPFEFLKLNGKLQLYALKSCTEQLRFNHHISTKILRREVVDGVFVVEAQATMTSGRSDESIGAVPIEGKKGEDKSNAMMKAETKAKRRVTLSICGLSMMDESEVESVKNARRVRVDMSTGEILEHEPVPEPSLEPAPTLAEDIDRHAVKNASKPAISYTALQEIGKLKKRFEKIDKSDEYYKCLDQFGSMHANQLADRDTAAKCYKLMSLRLADLEAAAAQDADDWGSVKQIADWKELSDTPQRIIVAGARYVYDDDAGNYKEAK